MDNPPARSVLDSAPTADDSGPGSPVTKVVDGDTIHIDRNGKDVTVRLLNVNTRERGEWGYKQGQSELRRLVEGKRVRVEHDKEKTDRFGRELGYVYAGDTNLNVEMVRSGWSPYYVKYGKGKLPDAFQSAEDEARRAKRGLWARPDEAKLNEERSGRAKSRRRSR